jgi:2-dehydropantoate 2-reductase
VVETPQPFHFVLVVDFTARLLSLDSEMRGSDPLSRAVHVVGAGGIGVAVAWCLTRAGCRVTIVETHGGKVKSGRADGLIVVGHEPVFPSLVAFEDWNPPPDAVLLLCTKTYDNPAVLARLRDPARLVPIQNGFDPQLDEQRHAGEGIASFVSECPRDRLVTRITRPGCLHLGARRRVSDAERAELTSLAAALARPGLFPVHLVADVRPYKAAKLMYNAAISPLAAAAGVDNGELLTDPTAKRLFFALLQENHAILRQAGMPLARIGPFHPDTVSRILGTPGLASLLAIFFRRSLRGTYCAMAPDIATGRTEMEAYNGHLIRLAGSFPCPLNRAAFRLIETMMRDRLAPARNHLHTLMNALPKGVRK